MATKPKEVRDKLETVIQGWRALRPDKSFGGMSLEEFKTAVQSSIAIRDEIVKLEEQLRSMKDQRDQVDKQNLAKAGRVVEGVIGEEGRDSDIYQAMGYVRKSERQTGLTRKKKSPEPK